MPVYLKDDMVLIAGGSVSTDAGCCCGDDCTNCINGILPFCIDDDGNCYTGQGCEGSEGNPDGCVGDIVPCDQAFFTQSTYCCDGGELKILETIDPDTCEDVQTIYFDDCPEGSHSGGVSNVLSDPVRKCGACCVEHDCTIGSQSDCTALDGIYHGDGSVCDPSPCGCLCFRDVSIDLTITMSEQCGTDCDAHPCDFNYTFTDSLDFGSQDLCGFSVSHEFVHDDLDVSLANFSLSSDGTNVSVIVNWHIQNLCCGAEFAQNDTQPVDLHCPTPDSGVTFAIPWTQNIGGSDCGSGTTTVVVTFS